MHVLLDLVLLSDTSCLHDYYYYYNFGLGKDLCRKSKIRIATSSSMGLCVRVRVCRAASVKIMAPNLTKFRVSHHRSDTFRVSYRISLRIENMKNEYSRDFVIVVKRTYLTTSDDGNSRMNFGKMLRAPFIGLSRRMKRHRRVYVCRVCVAVCVEEAAER